MARSRKQKPDKDYLSSSEFFNILYEDIKNDIKEDLQKTDEAKEYVSWIQNFSKKIVVITFALYVAINILILVLLYMQSKIGVTEFNTVYTEINETFRIVIGGYLIKAGVENTFKIGGNYLAGVTDSKLKLFQEKLGLKAAKPVDDDDENYDDFDESTSFRNDDTTV